MGMILDYEFEKLQILQKYIYDRETARNKLMSLLKRQVIKNIIYNSKLQTLKKAMVRYRYESSFVTVKCMIRSGLGSSDTEIFHPTYCYFLRGALHFELTRWKYLRLASKLEKISNKRKKRKRFGSLDEDIRVT